jgi:RNA polymerase sigma-70 factor (ECF subfamily)
LAVRTPEGGSFEAGGRGRALATDELARVFQDLFPVIRAKCARMLGDGDAAADIAQETFLRLWSTGVAGAPPAVRMRWIYRTSTRLAIDHLRRRRPGIGLASAGAPTGPVDESVLAARPWPGRAAALLPPPELEVAILARCDRMTEDEVAEVTGMSSRSVRRILVEVDQQLGRLERGLS